MHTYYNGVSYPEAIEALREEVLLQVFSDETRRLAIKDKAAEVLANRNSTKLVSPALAYLNSVVDSKLDSDIDWEAAIDTERYLNRLVSFVGVIYTDEAYQGLTKFLKRLLTEEPQHKDLFLIRTVFSLANISIKLNVKNSVSMLKSAMSHFKHLSQNDLRTLATYFDKLAEPAGIKEILTEHVTSGMPDAENTCLELLQKHDPDFVEKWKAEKETPNTQNKESS